jgi:peptidoglycan/LPS O-acetylase OafA/YrhL
MDKIRSLYLECLRISAALYVFIYHIGSSSLGDKLYFSTANFNKNLCLSNLSAHYFVIVFFVLSGFLITMSVTKPGMTFKSFLIARLGRLYSVLIPALIFSYLVDFVLIHYDLIPLTVVKSGDHFFISDHFFTRILLNISFLTQTWTLCSTPPLNTPFWSVNYEFIYYIAIAAIFLIKNNKLKLFLFIIILGIAWPKVLLLFPSWLAGSLLYFIRDKIIINKKISAALFLLSFCYLSAIIHNPNLIPFSRGTDDNQFFGFNLLFSWNYQADFIFSLVVAANIYFLFSISNSIVPKISAGILNNLHRFIMKIGNCSYTLYLFHLPLLFLFVSILPYDRTNYLHQIGLIILILTCIFFIAKYTEWKVAYWRSLVEKVLKSIQNIFKRKIKNTKHIYQ